MSTYETRSVDKRQTLNEEKTALLAEKFVSQVQVIRTPFTREELQAKVDYASLERKCEKYLGPQQEAQHLSAKFVDKDGEPILFYWAHRITTPDDKPPVQ